MNDDLRYALHHHVGVRPLLGLKTQIHGHGAGRDAADKRTEAKVSPVLCLYWALLLVPSP